MRIENPKLTKEEFGRIAHTNYYQKGVRPHLYKDKESADPNTYTAGINPSNITPESIVRRLNRLLRAHKKQ